MAVINYKTDNPLYAPGLITYGPKGDDGKQGQKGASLYFINSVMNDDTRNSITTKIKNSELLYNDNGDQTTEEYRIGDIIVDIKGNIYKIIPSNDGFDIDPKSIGNISPRLSKPFVVNSDGNFSIVDDTVTNDDYFFSLICSKDNIAYTYIPSKINDDNTLDTSGVEDLTVYYIEVHSLVTNETYVFKVNE